MISWPATRVRPVTPEFVDEFIGRWMDLFAEIASADHSDSGRLKDRLPRKFVRQTVSPAFKVDPAFKHDEGWLDEPRLEAGGDGDPGG